MATFWPNSPTTQITPPTSVSYNPKYTKGTTIGDLINQVGQYLKPAQNYMSYDQYAKPQQAAFDWWAQNVYRPEFERQTLNPYKEGLANQMAAGGSSQLGFGKNAANLNIGKQEAQYYDQLGSAQQAYSDMISQMYNTGQTNYYGSPTTFSNIGQTTYNRTPKPAKPATSPSYVSRMTTPISQTKFGSWY